METKDMIKKVKGEVSSVLSTVANKAEFIAKMSKLKIEITHKNAKVNSNLKDIGEYIYSKKSEFTNDKYIAEILKEVEEIKQSIEEIKSRIEDIKILEKEKHSQSEKRKNSQEW